MGAHADAGKGWVVFVESNTTGTGRLFASRAAARGYRPVILAEDPNRYLYIKQDRLPRVACATASIPALEQELKMLGRKAAVSGIFSSSEYFIENAALLAREWNLPGADPESLKICRNKATQRRSLRAAGLNTPRFAVVSSIAAAVAALKTIQLPAVIKPTLGSGSVGVKLCRTPAEAAAHAGILLQQKVNERAIPLPAEILVEQYVIGDEFSVETLGGKIVEITRKHVSQEPFFIETGHDFPATIPQETRRRISATVRRALRYMGLLWGPAHIELRLTEAGPTIIEINPRLAGGFIPEIVRLALGVDMIDETLKMVIGAISEIRRLAQARHASIRFLIPAKAGTITAVTGIAEARKVEGVADIQLYRKAGDVVQIRHDFRDRIGHVITCGNSESQAAGRAEMARSRIAIATRTQ
jgi:argininosuccinate lyase